jgi:asparagine synthase (glutamine-hydrolysing)
MPGFSGAISKVSDILVLVDPAFPPENEQYSFQNVWVRRSVVHKFLDDKVFKDDGEIFICTDGIFLNSTQLRNRYSVDTNFELLKVLYRASPLSFPNELRGTFSGCLYDKSTHSVHLFTDHIGAKPIFYFFDTNTSLLLFGSDLKKVTALMKCFNLQPGSLSTVGAYCVLTFGFMLQDHTLVDGVKRLRPGSILTWDKGIITTKQYYRLNNSPSHKERETSVITTNLNERFDKAIMAEYDKDREYSYRHIGTLSGGLDSRMNLLSARKCGYNDLYTMTMSQSDYLDETIAKKIAGHCGFNSIFYALDNGDYLCDIDRPVSANDGLVLYSGSAHLYRILSVLEWRQFGLLHTGMLGDVVVGGTYLCGEKQVKAQPGDGSYSKTLLSRIQSIATEVTQEYENSELYLFDNRGVNGTLNGYRMAFEFTESTSPFLHVDFLEYAIRIQPKMRRGYRIYHQWIAEHLHEAAKFPWEFSGMKIGRQHLFWHRVRRAREVGIGFMRGPRPGYSMVPFDYWFKTNKQLVESLERYFQSHIETLAGTPELYKDATVLFKTGTSLEKTQVLTLLAAVQLLGLKVA